MMTIISLIAIYAAVNESSAKTMNTLLLGCGVIIFLCIIIADLYSFLFFHKAFHKVLSKNTILDL